MKKHRLCYLLMITILFTGFICHSALAQNDSNYDATVMLNPGNAQITIIDNKVTSNKIIDVAPFIQDGFTLMPVRGVLEALGATVSWNTEVRQVEVTTTDTRILLTVDSNIALVNDESVTMDKPAQIINNRTLIPLRFVAENLGYAVKWNGTENKVEIINKTIASADGVVIGYGELDQAIAWAEYFTEKQYGSDIWTEIAQNGQTWGEVFPQMVLNQLIVGEIVEAAALSQNIQVTEDEINSGLVAYQNLIKEDQNLAKVVKQFNIGQRFLRGMVREDIVGTKYKANYVDSIEISENDMKQYYDGNKSIFAYEKVKASHILIKTIAESTSDDKAYNQSALQKATDILKRAKTGEDFAELARDFSEDAGSAANGGELGYFSKGMMVNEFEQAAFAMNKGQISDLVKTVYGYHIIKVEDHISGTYAYDKVKDSIEKLLTDAKVQEHINSLVSQANVKIYGLAYE